jgi:hypothetical protein
MVFVHISTAPLRQVGNYPVEEIPIRQNKLFLRFATRLRRWPFFCSLGLSPGRYVYRKLTSHSRHVSGQRRLHGGNLVLLVGHCLLKPGILRLRSRELTGEACVPFCEAPIFFAEPGQGALQAAQLLAQAGDVIPKTRD